MSMRSTTRKRCSGLAFPASSMRNGLFSLICGIAEGKPQRIGCRDITKTSVPAIRWTSPGFSMKVSGRRICRKGRNADRPSRRPPNCVPRRNPRLDAMGLFGILLGLALLIWLAYRGWTILLLAPAAALIAAAFAGGPLLAYWTQTFMDSASRFVAQFFPLFLLGALFGKLMEDSGSVTAIAEFMSRQLGPQRAVLTVVLAGALVTYGGVSLFVAFFVLVPMAQSLFRSAAIPNRLIPAAIALGTSTFTMSALPGTPAIQNAIPMPFFGTTPLAAPGLGIIASVIMFAFGLWWLGRAENAARRNGEGFGLPTALPADEAAEDETLRQRATTAREFDPREVPAGNAAKRGRGLSWR